MKKLIFLGFTTLALVGCSSSISNSSQLVGNWHCSIDYDDFNIRTEDNLKFSANGAMSNQGSVNYPLQKPIFVYTVKQNGRWNLQNNSIVYRITSESIRREHNAQIQDELKRDSAMRQFEENLFNSLSNGENNKTIELIVTDFDENEMDIKQEIKGQSVYKGQCVKL